MFVKPTGQQNTTVMNRTAPKDQLFLLLFGMGLLGVLTLLAAPLPLPTDQEIPLSPTLLRLLGLVQSALLVAVAVTIGLFTAPNVGLHAPLVEGVITGRPIMTVLRMQGLPAAIGATLGALVLLVYALLQPLLMPELLAAAEGTALPLLMRVFYGGITEELLLRWGMMSFCVWLLWRLVQRRRDTPRDGLFWLGNGISAILFGLAHLPSIAIYGVPLTVPIIASVLLGNAAVGLIYGWLYWRKGLGAAMLAHAGTHLLMVFVVTPLVSPWLGQ